MNAGSALAIIAGTAVLALGLGLRARHGKSMDLEEWTVGGRRFGSIFVFLLLAGEIYTTFTFLGGSGYAYGNGSPAYYIISYGCLAYMISYRLLPPIWCYARERHLVSQPDFFVAKYDSPALGILVSVVGIIALAPYLVLQLKGLGNIVSTASYGLIPPGLAIWIGAAMVTAYVMVSGLHGSAWTAVLKDVTILAVVVFLGIYLPIHWYCGFGRMFYEIQAAKPGFLALPAKGQSLAWFDSTVLLTAIGFFMWPHGFAAIYSAKYERVFRHNAILLPLYQLILLFVFFVGFAAILQVPGLTGPQIDLALFRLSLKTFSPWVVGLIGGAGMLTALVPGSLILLAAATLLSKNIYRVFRGATSDAHVSAVARWLVPAVALVSVYFTLRGGQTIVALLLMGYSSVTQFFPSVVMSLQRRNPVTKEGAFIGICVGVITVAVMTSLDLSLAKIAPTAPPAFQDLNIGIVALGLNIVATAVVSAATRRVPSPHHA